MSFVVRELGKILTIKLTKCRSDTLSDQFHRIFLVKVMLVCSFCTGINWYKDSLHCLSNKGVSSGFASSACWIQGVYIYEELKNRSSDVAYYGIPLNIDHDGMLEDGTLCNTAPRSRKLISKQCNPLTKTFFLQYQWLPFYIATLAIVYYLPYILHMYGNHDMICLMRLVDDGDPGRVVHEFFNRQTNTLCLQWIRIFYNFIVKVVYFVADLVVFHSTDELLHGKFQNYGLKWISWTRLENHIVYDYMGYRDHPKPGHELLPPFGYCELSESSKDMKESYTNHHKFVCEVSQNILSQYALLVVWFVVVMGIVVSIIGLGLLVYNHLINFATSWSYRHISKILGSKHSFFAQFSLRELQYLQLIKRKDVVFYGEVLTKLKDETANMSSGDNSGSLPCETPPPGFEEAIKDSPL